MTGEPITRPDEAAKALAASWLDLAGPKLAYAVAGGQMCDRCARAALTTIGVAGGIPPGDMARDGLGGYRAGLAYVADQIAAMHGLDGPVDLTEPPWPEAA